VQSGTIWAVIIQHVVVDNMMAVIARHIAKVIIIALVMGDDIHVPIPLVHQVIIIQLGVILIISALIMLAPYVQQIIIVQEIRMLIHVPIPLVHQEIIIQIGVMVKPTMFAPYVKINIIVQGIQMLIHAPFVKMVPCMQRLAVHQLLTLYVLIVQLV
jgi:hypothetical protein